MNKILFGVLILVVFLELGYLFFNEPRFRQNAIPQISLNQKSAFSLDKSFAKGYDQLKFLYGNPSFVTTASFTVYLQGKFISLSSYRLVIKDVASKKELILSPLDRSPVLAFLEIDKEKLQKPKKLDENELKKDDLVEITISINPFTGKMQLVKVLKLIEKR